MRLTDVINLLTTANAKKTLLQELQNSVPSEVGNSQVAFNAFIKEHHAKLTELRTAAKINQRNFAKMAKTHQARISDVERGISVALSVRAQLNILCAYASLECENGRSDSVCKTSGVQHV